MMSGHTVVQVTDYDLFSGGERQRSKLLEVLGNLRSTAAWCSVYDLDRL